MTRMRKEIAGINLELNKIISKNLKKLIVANGMSEGELCRMLEQQGKISMDRTLLNKIINHPDQNSISLIFLVSIADFFQVSVDDLLKESFDEEHIFNGLIQERKIGSDDVIEFEVSGEKIEAIHMLPGYTHNIINLSDTQDLVTVMWANEQFDANHPDTFGELVK